MCQNAETNVQTDCEIDSGFAPIAHRAAIVTTERNDYRQSVKNTVGFILKIEAEACILPNTHCILDWSRIARLVETHENYNGA